MEEGEEEVARILESIDGEVFSAQVGVVMGVASIRMGMATCM